MAFLQLNARQSWSGWLWKKRDSSKPAFPVQLPIQRFLYRRVADRGKISKIARLKWPSGRMPERFAVESLRHSKLASSETGSSTVQDNGALQYYTVQ